MHRTCRSPEFAVCHVAGVIPHQDLVLWTCGCPTLATGDQEPPAHLESGKEARGQGPDEA